MSDKYDTTWEEKLQTLKESAPQPVPVAREYRLSSAPSCYGEEFHGTLHHPQAEGILKDVGQGAYLIRLSTAECYILSFIFDGIVFNYETFYYDGSYWIGKKQFNNIADMVKNGLESMHIEKYATEFTRMMSSAFKMETIKRGHHFQTYWFKKPKICGYCNSIIWGPLQERLKCLECGFSVHQRCGKELEQSCKPSLKYVKGTFGIDLVAYCMAHGVEIPPIISKCTKEVEERGLEEEGIYRVSGSVLQIEDLKEQFDAGMDVDLSVVDDINTICGLLKLYLKSIPQKLIPFAIFQNIFDFFESDPSATDEQKFLVCRKELSKLDPYRAKTLTALFQHFQKVAAFSEKNFMKPQNLATIFCPTLLQTMLPDPKYMHILVFIFTTPNII